MSLSLAGNKSLEEALPVFWQETQAIKAAHPLPEPFAYHRHQLRHTIWSVLSALDQNGVDLRGLVRGKSVLDMACADGELAFFLERHCEAKSLCGLDTDLAVTRARGRGFAMLKRHLDSGVDFITADIHALDFTTLPRFDVVFCLGFLYHSPHPMWVLENLAHKTDVLVLGTKVFDHEQPYVYVYEPGEVGGDITNWMCPSIVALRRMIERARFDIDFLQRLETGVRRGDPVDPARDVRAIAMARPNLQRMHWLYSTRRPPVGG